MQRDTLQWKITIPDDGALIENGVVPMLIEWPAGVHPVQTMPDLGCRLMRLEVHHPQPEKLTAMWTRIGLHRTNKLAMQQAAPNTKPSLLAHIATPDGMKILY